MIWSAFLGALLLAFLLVGFGVALVVEPWLAAIGMAAVAIGFPVAVLIWRYPEFGIVLLVFLGSQILHPELLDLRLPIGGGLELPDLLLLGLAALLVAKQLFSMQTSDLPTSRLFAPVLVFFGLALFSTLRALLLFEVEVSWTFSELRGIAYFFVLLLASWELRQRDQIVRLFTGLFIVGLATVAIMIAQQFFGSIPLVAGQQTTGWQIVDIDSGSITRIRPPAHLLLYYLSLAAFALMAFYHGGKKRIVMLAMTLLLNLVLLLTFTRAQWLASTLGILVCIAFIPREMKLALASIALVIIFIGGVVLLSGQSSALRSMDANQFLGPLMDRVQSVVSVDETLNSYSLQTRQFQTRAAEESIARNPLLGVGLGNTYRRIASGESLDRYSRFSRFMENSYLYVATKMGLPSLAVLVWLMATILVILYKGYKSARDPTLKGLSLASLAAVVGILFWGITHPVLFSPQHTLTIGLIGGVGEAMGRMNR